MTGRHNFVWVELNSISFWLRKSAIISFVIFSNTFNLFDDKIKNTTAKLTAYTKVFAKAGFDIKPSAMHKHLHRFRIDVQRSAIVLNFNIIFLKWAFVPGWTINEPPAIANPFPLTTPPFSHSIIDLIVSRPLIQKGYGPVLSLSHLCGYRMPLPSPFFLHSPPLWWHPKKYFVHK